MAVIQNDGKRERRRPSLKGGVMLDVVNGQERARAWPKERGKRLNPKTKEQNEWFRQAQWATKYMAPEVYWQAQQAVQGTPLLPRDILTMMMAGRLAAFTGPDGRTIWSAQVLSDVSTALDVITDIPGSMLVRGEDGWVQIAPGVPGQALVIPMEGGLPQFGDQSGGGGGGGPALYGNHVIGGSAQGASNNYVIGVPLVLTPGSKVSKIAFFSNAAYAGANFQVGLYANDPLKMKDLIVTAADRIYGVVVGHNEQALSEPYVNETDDTQILFAAIGLGGTVVNITTLGGGRACYFASTGGALSNPAGAQDIANNGWNIYAIS